MMTLPLRPCLLAVTTLMVAACTSKPTIVPLPNGEYQLEEIVTGSDAEAPSMDEVAAMGVTLTVTDGEITVQQDGTVIVTSAIEQLPEEDAFEGCPRQGTVDLSDTYQLTSDFELDGMSFDSSVIYRSCSDGPIEITPRDSSDDTNPIQCDEGPCLIFSD